MSTAPLQVLTIGLQDEIFAVETDRVHEVLDQVPITPVPNSRTFVRGLINVRGKVVPVADLRLRFGMKTGEVTRDTRIVVMDVFIDGEPTLVGTLADRVYAVTEVAAASMEEAPRIGMKWRAEFVRAIGKRKDEFIIILDIDRVFATDETAYIGSKPPEAGSP
ncbi:MAG: chemotaxis protein CheW [Alphaproteobacteria bacterium]|nr:chemotaxis protein CheW [Alphaproteobacteria bacterium]